MEWAQPKLLERRRLPKEHRKILTWGLFKSEHHNKLIRVALLPRMTQWAGNTWVFSSSSGLMHCTFWGYVNSERFLVLVYVSTVVSKAEL